MELTSAIRRAAFLVTPHVGGTYTVYRNMRAALARQGIQLEWVGFSKTPEAISADPQFIADRASGQLIDAGRLTQEEIGAALIAKIVAGKYDLVFINVLTGYHEMSVAAYLPPAIRRVMIVHNITPGTFTCARIVAPYVHAAVGVCPRIQEHLVSVLGLPAAQTFCVPNALDTLPYEQLKRSVRPLSEPFRLLFLGRVLDMDKGVFWLPAILKSLGDMSWRMTIAGDGPDFVELKQRLAPLKDRVTFLGYVKADQIAALANEYDAMVMPSRFEGFGYTLIEAMAGGCVPVASRIRGVTDYVVQEGKTGLLFEVGKTAEAAAAIQKIAGDDALLARLSQAGRADVHARFSIPAFSEEYRKVLAHLASPPPLRRHRHGQPFQLLPFRGAWRRMIPRSLSNLLRTYLYRS